MAATKKTAKAKKKVKKAAKRRVMKRKAVKRRAAKPKKSVKRTSARKKRPAVRKAASKKAAGPKPVGRVTHFYTEIKVAVIKFLKPVKQGTQVYFKGATTDFSQKLDSMQYDHKPLATAPKGKQVGVKVKSRVREGDQVYL